MINKSYSINIRNFNNTNILKFGENYNANKGESKKDSNGNISIQLREQKNRKNQVIENLEKLKQNLLEQKRTLIGREMDPEDKKYKIKELNESIQTIEAQIQQVNIQQKEEEQQKKQAEIEKKQAEDDRYKENGDEKREDVIIAASLNELIKFSNTKDNIHRLKDIRNREKIESMYISPDENPKTYSYKRLAQIHKSAATIDSRIGKEVRNLNKSASAIKDKLEMAVDKKENAEDKDKRVEEEAES